MLISTIERIVYSLISTNVNSESFFHKIFFKYIVMYITLYFSNTSIDFLLSVLPKHRYLSFIKDRLLMLSHMSSYASSSHAVLP